MGQDKHSSIYEEKGKKKTEVMQGQSDASLLLEQYYLSQNPFLFFIAEHDIKCMECWVWVS